MSGYGPSGASGGSSASKSGFSRLVPAALSGASHSSGGTSTSSTGSSIGVGYRALEALEALALTHGSHPSRTRYTSTDSLRGLGSRTRDEGGSPSLPLSATGSDTTPAANSPNATRRNSLVHYTGSSGKEYGGGNAGSSSIQLNDSSFSRIWNNSYGAGQSSSTPGESHFFAPGAFSFEADRRFLTGSAVREEREEDDQPGLYWERRTRKTSDSIRSHRRSRNLKYVVSSQGASERGITAIAKSGQNDGRVAVVGRSFIKVLQVPYNEEASPPHSFASSSLLASRRSRSKGSSTGDRSTSRGTSSSSDRQSDGVREILDVRAGARLGPTYAATDVRWGYSATKEKIATSFSTGAIALWDLEREGTKLETFKYEHDRAVNRVVFGGQTGSWLVSGGQNGDMKLWDIRDSRPASMVLKSAAPVRDLSFSPSSAQPFTLVAVTASGTLTRYDIRYVSRASGGATDRIAAHMGACLALDWRDNYRGRGEGDRKEGGWVATAGIDKTVKIWDFSLPNLSTKAVRTLHASQPVQCVAWHPTIPTEVASSPIPAFGSEDHPSASGFSRLAGVTEAQAIAAWKNEIDIWDTRTPYLPKMTIKTDEPVNAFVYCDEDLFWTGSKSSTTFAQYDITADAYHVRDVLPKPAGVWSTNGTFAFIDQDQSATQVLRRDPTTPYQARQVTSAVLKPDAVICSATNMDPTMDPAQTALLADSLRVEGPARETCLHNLDVYSQAGRTEAKQIWELALLWLDQVDSETTLSQLMAPVETEAKKAADGDDDPAADDGGSSGIHTSSATPIESGGSIHIFNRHRSISREALVPGRSPALQAADLRPSILEDFAEETLSSAEATPEGQENKTFDRHFAKALSSEATTASASPRAESSGRHYPPIHRDPGLNDLADRMSSSYSQSRSRGRSPVRREGAVTSSSRQSVVNGEEDEGEDEADDGRNELVDDHEDSAAVDSESSGSSDDSDHDEIAIDGSTVLNQAKWRRKMAQARSRRTSSNSTSHQRPSGLRDTSVPHNNAQNGSNANSRTRSRHDSQETNHKLSSRRQSAINEIVSQMNAPPSVEMPFEELQRRELVKLVRTTNDLARRNLLEAVQEYTDRGDSQLGAVFCCVFQDSELGIDPLFAARVTTAYIDQLRRMRLDVPAAALIRATGIERLRNTSQNHVVYHTLCGTCGKAIESAPFDRCHRCRTQLTRCCVCDMSVNKLAIWCSECGHCAHPSCLASFAASLADKLDHIVHAARRGHQHGPGKRMSGGTKSGTSSAEHSYPTTPSIVTPALKGWLWGELESSGILSDGGGASMEADVDAIQHMLHSCPAKFCDHEGCLMASVLTS